MPRPGLHMGGMGVANASSWAPHGRDGSGQCLVLGSNASSWAPHGRDGSCQCLVLGSTYGRDGSGHPGLHIGRMGVANASSWADDHFLATQKAAQFLGKFCTGAWVLGIAS